MPLRVSIEFVPGGQPPHGRLSAPGRPDRPFSGWTELFAVLDRTLQAEQTTNERNQPCSSTSSDAR
jgi:hypothetical protein